MAVRSPVPIPGPERVLPRKTRAANPQLNEAAEQIGSALGRVVNKIRELPLCAGRQIQSGVRGRLEVIRARSQQQGARLATRLRATAESTLAELRVRPQENVQLARIRARRIARERPLEVILVAFGAAFLFGAALRIWRSSRES